MGQPQFLTMNSPFEAGDTIKLLPLMGEGTCGIWNEHLRIPLVVKSIFWNSGVWETDIDGIPYVLFHPVEAMQIVVTKQIRDEII